MHCCGRGESQPQRYEVPRDWRATRAAKEEGNRISWSFCSPGIAARVPIVSIVNQSMNTSSHVPDVSAPEQIVHPCRVVFLVENGSFPRDRRVLLEATTLKRSGYEINVVCRQSDGDRAHF